MAVYDPRYRFSRSSRHQTLGKPRSINTDVPLANVGEIIPFIIGRRRVSRPNVIAYGKPTALTETISETSTRTYEVVKDRIGSVTTYEEITETVTTETTIPIGFLVDITVGICLGPDVVLKGIYADNNPIWEGTVGPSRATWTLPVNETAFSGCQVAFNGGSFTQPVDPWTVPSVTEPPTPAQLYVEQSLATFSNGSTWYEGLNTPEAQTYQPWPTNFNPQVFGGIVGQASLWDVIRITDAQAMYDSSSGAALLVKGKNNINEIFVKINDRTPVRCVKHHAMTLPGITHYQTTGDGWTHELFGLRDFIGQTVDLSIEPYGPGRLSNMPAYTGIAYMIFRNVRADMRLDSLSFEVERFPNPLSLANAQNRKKNDINLSTAMHEVLHSDWGGAGIKSQYIGNSFKTHAPLFASEEGYCSIVLDEETSAGAVLGELQKQSYSMVFSDPGTSKIEVSPIRNTGFNMGSVMSLGRSNVLALNEFKKGSWTDTLEVVQGMYPDRENNYEPTPLIAQSTQLQDTRGSRRSVQIPFPFAPRADIVAPAVARLLSQSLVPTFSVNVLADRTAAGLRPGDIALLNWPQYGIYSEPIIVNKVRKHPRDENTVSVTAVQYKTPGVSDVLAMLPDDTTPTDLGTSPLAPLDVSLMTAPFFFARGAGILSISTVTNKSYPMFFPVPANSLQLSCELTLQNLGQPSVKPTTIATNIPYSMYGSLETTINKYDGWTTGLLPDIVLNSVVNEVPIPDLTSLIRNGRYLLIIGEEIFAFNTVTNIGAEKVQLSGVRRALIDTVASTHNPGAHAFIINNGFNFVSKTGFDTPLSYQPTWKLISLTVNEKGRPNNPTTTLTRTGWIPEVNRSVAPPRPHDTRIEGIRRNNAINLARNETYLVSWKTRSRVSTQLVFQADASEESESYSGIFQKHRVYIRGNNGTLRLIGETDDDAGNINQLAITIPANMSIGVGNLFVRSFMRNSESVFDDEIAVNIFDGPSFEFSYSLEV